MKGKGFFFILCVCMTFISCSNVAEDKNDVRSNASVLKFLDIQNAKNLYIGTSNSGTRSAGDSATTQKLFKITEDGYVEEVKYLDENKKEITISQQPAVIQTVNEEYIFVGFGWSGYVESSYLVRKSDGAVFDMTKVGNPEYHSEGKKEHLIDIDRQNKIYYKTIDNHTSRRKIIKIDLNGNNFLTATTVSASVDSVDSFIVDRDGNIIYSALVETSDETIQRLRKTNGDFEKVPQGYYWIGLDGYLYYQTTNSDEYKEMEFDYDAGIAIEYGYPIRKITIDNSYNLNDTIYGYVIGTFKISNSYRSYGVSGYKINTKDRMYFIDNLDILEVHNENNSPRRVVLDSLDISTVRTVYATENYYYIAGVDSNENNFLVQVNPINDSYEHLLPQGVYDVYSFTASETDGITFNALRMNDLKKIIGKVGIDGGDVTIIDEESDIEITYLERIN